MRSAINGQDNGSALDHDNSGRSSSRIYFHKSPVVAHRRHTGPRNSTEYYFPAGYRNVVVRMENMSLRACINAGRAMSTSMRRALKIMYLVKVSYNFQVVAKNFLTDANTVADFLSRGHSKQARDSI